MLEKVRKYIEFHHMLEMDDKVVMGISGGADSVCLLFLMLELKKEYNLSLSVVHVHHGIRGEEADKDAEYVEKLCTEYGICFYLFRENIPELAKMWKMSEEEAGRKYRYQCFYQVMEQVGAGKLATAHHMGDQAETLLFHLVRGTNLSGMAGIAPVNGKIIRPLLQCRKEEIINWLAAKGIVWREDATNADNSYARNKLRNQVIPILEEINDQAVEHIADFAECITEYEKFFQKTVRRYLDDYVIFETDVEKYSVEGAAGCWTNAVYLKQQEKILSEAVIYEMIVFACGGKKDITKEHVAAVYGLLYKQSGRKVMLPYQAEAEISYEKLIIRKCLEEKEQAAWSRKISLKEIMEKKEPTCILLPDESSLTIQIFRMEDMEEKKRERMLNDVLNSKNNYTKLFDCDTIEDTLYVRTPDKQDYFIINDRGDRKKLSRYFIDSKVPSEQRKHKIVIAGGHEVLWIAGGRRCEAYKINNNTKHVLLLMYEGERK